MLRCRTAGKLALQLAPRDRGVLPAHRSILRTNVRSVKSLPVRILWHVPARGRVPAHRVNHAEPVQVVQSDRAHDDCARRRWAADRSRMTLLMAPSRAATRTARPEFTPSCSMLRYS